MYMYRTCTCTCIHVCTCATCHTPKFPVMVVIYYLRGILVRVTKPVGQLKFNGFKVVGDIFLKVQVTDDPPR